MSFRVSATAPEVGSRSATLKALLSERLLYVKLKAQSTNRLRQYLLAVFPEGEGEFFGYLKKVV